MDALALVLISGTFLLIAYFTYGRWLSRRVFQLDPDVDTPATTERDGRDFVPTPKSIIFGHHFTSIAGTGPIVGPAIAVMWGWLPAILWVVIGAIFIGAVHDLGAIVVSLRKKGRSIGDIAGDLLGSRARLIFLCILIVGLWIVLAVFGLVIAAVLRQYPAAVFPVLVQIPLAVLIGLFVHKRGKSIVVPSIVALVVMYASVAFGDVGLLGQFNAFMASQPIFFWVAFLLAYAYVASVLPVWVLLQPRDYINALQLLTALALITLGLIAAATLGGPSNSLPLPLGEVDSAPAESGEGHSSYLASTDAPLPNPLPEGEGAGTPTSPSGRGRDDEVVAGEGLFSSSPDQSSPSVLSVPSVVSSDRPKLELVAPMINWQPVGAPPMLPVLFITIACGACSGFHCLVGSGTTSKQITKETHATAVGYGAMLTEGFLATLVIAACAAGIGMGPLRSTVFHEWICKQTNTDLDGSSWINDLPWIQSVPSSGFTEPRVLGDPGIQEGPWLSTGDGAWRVLEEHVGAGLSAYEVELTGRLAFNKQYESWSAAGSLGAKVGAFVEGSANFVASLGIARDIAIALMAVMVASFAATTMDTACRLQRYVIQELSSTFLPRRKRYSCATCGYDLSGHVDTDEDPHPSPLPEGEGAGGQDSEIEGARTSPPNSSSPTSPPGRGRGDEVVAGEGLSSSLDQSSSSVPSVLNIRCPECGSSHPAEKLRHPDREASWKQASPLNPFKWLASVHGATLFAVATAALLAAIPPEGQPWTLANAGQGALILWPLFGATNQLLAGFAFVVIVAWLIATKRPKWFAIPPAIIMLIVPAAAMIWQGFIGNESNPSWLSQGAWLLLSISTVTLALEAWLVIETAHRFIARKSSFING